MYTKFYGLKADPFRMSPDHSFCFRHASFSKAKAYMQYALHREEGFVVITGKPGTGKTTLIGDLLSDYNQTDFDIAKLTGAQLEGDDLLRMVSHAFRVSISGTIKSETINSLHRYLTDIYKRKRRPLLIIDEAQGLATAAMEELRLLTNLQIDGQPLLQIFLIGQTELRDLILDPTLEQLHQRIVAACHLEPLNPLDTASYVMHRLECTGWSGSPMINIDIFPELFNFSRGIPRRINLAFSRLLLHGSLEEKNWLDTNDIRLVVEELREEDLFPGDPSSVIELHDFDVTELLSLVQPRKPKTVLKIADSEHYHQSSLDVPDSRKKDLTSEPDAQPIKPSNPDLKLEEHKVASVNPDDENREDLSVFPIIDEVDRKKTVAEPPAVQSIHEVIYPQVGKMAHEVTNSQVKVVENNSSTSNRNSKRHWYGDHTRRAVSISVAIGLVLTGTVILAVPSLQLQKVLTDTTWSLLSGNQVHDLVSRRNGDDLPLPSESEPQLSVESDPGTLGATQEKQDIGHRSVSGDLMDTISGHGLIQSNHENYEPAIPLPVRAVEPADKIEPKKLESPAEIMPSNEGAPDPGEQLIATNGNKEFISSYKSGFLHQQKNGMQAVPSFIMAEEISFDFNSGEIDPEYHPNLVTTLISSGDHAFHIFGYKDSVVQRRSDIVTRYLLGKGVGGNHLLVEANIQETQIDTQSLRPWAGAHQPVNDDTTQSGEANETDPELPDSIVTPGSLTKIAVETDIVPIALTAQLDGKLRVKKIEELLRLGEQALTRYRLRYPEDQSAWYFYSQVIKLDPGNEVAVRGFKKIAKRYARLARNRIAKQQYVKANLYINRGLEVVPGNRTLMELEQELDKRQAELLVLQRHDARLLAEAASRSRTKKESEPSNEFGTLRKFFASGKLQTPEQLFRANDR